MSSTRAMLAQAVLGDLCLLVEPSRTVDLAISVAINFQGVFDPAYEWQWGAGGDEIEGWQPYPGKKDIKRGAFLDPVQFVPRWTRSIDTALQLVPSGYRWYVADCDRDGGKPVASVWLTKVMLDTGTIPRSEGSTPAIALCIAALKTWGAA